MCKYEKSFISFIIILFLLNVPLVTDFVMTLYKDKMISFIFWSSCYLSDHGLWAVREWPQGLIGVLKCIT